MTKSWDLSKYGIVRDLKDNEIVTYYGAQHAVVSFHVYMGPKIEMIWYNSQGHIIRPNLEYVSDYTWGGLIRTAIKKFNKQS